MGFPPHSMSAPDLAALLAAEREGEPFLAFRDGSGDLRLAPLTDTKRVCVGRRSDNDVVLGWDSEVSRAHALFECVGGTWLLVDEGLSRNGCYVNGERVDGRAPLSDGAVVRLGGTSIVFRAPHSRAEMSTVAATAAALVEISDAERRVLVALCHPLLGPDVGAASASNAEIAERLCLSPATVKTHIRMMCIKLGIEELPANRKRAELARRALQSGLVSRRDVRD